MAFGRDGGGLTIYVGESGEKYSDAADWRDLILEGRLTPDTVLPTRRDGVLSHGRADVQPELRVLFELLAPEPRPSAPVAVVVEPETPIAEPAAPPPVEAAPLAPAGGAPSTHSRDAPAAIAEDPPFAPRSSGRARSSARRFGSPPVGGLIAGFAGVALAAFLIVGAIRSSPGDVAEVATGTATTQYVARETRVRLEPTAQGNAPVGSLSRGDRVQGVWVDGVDGRSRWLRITDGAHTGAFVWGANLVAEQPPALRTMIREEQIAATSGLVLSGPRPDANVLGRVEPGQSFTVVGRTGSGWMEVARDAGGVGYVDAAVFETAALSPAASPPAMFARRSIISADGWNAVRIGMTLEEAEAALGEPLTTDLDVYDDPSCRIYGSPAHPDLSFMVQDGRVATISIGETASGARSSVRTDEGVGLGSSEADLRSAYPAIEAEPNIYGGVRMFAWRPGRSRGVRFNLDDGGRVYDIEAGSTSIQYVEGCL